ncbi:MAG: hypothetical protein ABR903_07610, partial [Thermodesulfovibrionales bacterium]
AESLLDFSLGLRWYLYKEGSYKNREKKNDFSVGREFQKRLSLKGLSKVGSVAVILCLYPTHDLPVTNRKALSYPFGSPLSTLFRRSGFWGRHTYFESYPQHYQKGLGCFVSVQSNIRTVIVKTFVYA